MNTEQEAKPVLKINYRFLLAVFTIILISAAVTTVIFIKNNKTLNKKIAETAESKRPANLELIIIADQTCKDCFDLNPILSQIANENVKINSNQVINSTSTEGKQLIEKFSIKKLPTFLVKGEMTKNTALTKFFSQAGDTADKTFVFRQVGGPYTDVTTGKVKGRVNLVLITDVTCTECYDVTQHETILKQFGMTAPATVVETKSPAGRTFISRYGIKLVPTFILKGEINEYPDFTKVWPEVGMVAYDGAYVFTKGVPFMGTYKDLSTNKVITPAPEPAK